MSYTTLLINTCSVLEDVETTVDAYGTLTPADWQPIAALTDIDCRLSRIEPSGDRGREIRVGAEVVIADHTLFMQDVAITEQHRVRIGSVDYRVLLVESFQDEDNVHHKQIWLSTVR